MAPKFIIAHASNIAGGFKLNSGSNNVIYLLLKEIKIACG